MITFEGWGGSVTLFNMPMHDMLFRLDIESTTIETRFVLLLLRHKIMQNLCTLNKIRSGSFGGPLGGPVGFGKVRRLRGVILAK